jgi:hypothetical protein
MLPVVTTGVVLSSVTSASAEQEIGIDVGYESICEPTVVPGHPNLLGGETGRAMSNMGLQPLLCTTLPPPYALQGFPVFVPNGLSACASSPFDFNFGMHFPPLYCPYGQDPPPPGLPEGYQPYVDVFEDARHDSYPPSALNSSPQTENSFSVFEGVPYSTSCHDSAFASLPSTSMNHNALGYVMDAFLEQESDDAYHCTAEDPSSTYSSSSHSSVHSLRDEPFQLVQGTTGETLEVFSATPPSATSRRRSGFGPKEGPRNIGGRRQPLSAEQRDQASNTRRIGACMRCSFQRNNVSFLIQEVRRPLAHP